MRIARGLAVALAVATAFLAAPAAYALPSDDDFTDQERAASIQPLDTGIMPFETAITPLETVKRQGSETEMLLQADLLFDFAKWDLSAVAVAKIGELVAKIPQGITVTVAGHTDSKGDTASNQTLSEHRAQAVADAIARARPDLVLKVSGYGESKPIAKNQVGGKDNPDGRAQNRRVEVRYTG